MSHLVQTALYYETPSVNLPEYVPLDPPARIEIGWGFWDGKKFLSATPEQAVKLDEWLKKLP